MRTTVGATASIAALLIAGCSSSDSSGQPPETTSTPTSETTGEPKVENPKDLAAIKDPCQLIKPEQAQQLGTGNPHPEEESEWGQPGCKWSENNTSISISPDTVQKVGIAHSMKMESKIAPDGEIQGNPYIMGQKGETTCSLYVATTEEDVFGVTVFTDPVAQNTQDPCQFSLKAAETVLSNLPAAN